MTATLDPFAVEKPSDVAERLPKALIHRNVPGEGVHALLAEADRAWLAADLELGFDRVYLHEVGPEQDRFIEAFGAQVLPKLKGLQG